MDFNGVLLRENAFDLQALVLANCQIARKRYAQDDGAVFTIYDDMGIPSHGMDSYPDDEGVKLCSNSGVATIFTGELTAMRQNYVSSRRGNYSIEVNSQVITGMDMVRYEVVNMHLLPYRAILKMNLTSCFKVVRRRDGVPGGELERKLDGTEYPLFNYERLIGKNGESMTLVTNEIFSCDVQPNGLLRLTLMRTPFYAHQWFEIPRFHAHHPMDMQMQKIHFTLMYNATPAAIQNEIYRQMAPLTFSETTLGMKGR